MFNLNHQAFKLNFFSSRIQPYSTQLFNLTWKNRKNNVFVVGGTHGNEPTGVQLVNYYNSFGSDYLKSKNFNITALLANPRAILRNSRYYDVDLNRCFTLKELNSPNNHHLYEPMRASHLNKKMGKKGAPNRIADVIFDLHTTTADTGVLLIMDRKDTFAHQIAQYVQKNHSSEIKIGEWEESGDHPFLPSIGHSGMTVEVGPIPQGCLFAEIYLETKTVLEKAFEFIEKHNEYVDSHSDLPAVDDTSIEVFQRVGAIDFPRNNHGQIVGMVHNDLQHRDFTVLQDGDPIILHLDGSVVIWDQKQHSEPIYPFFINEAAYYEKKVAFAIAKKVSVKFPASFIA